MNWKHTYGMPNRWQHCLCCDWLCSIEYSIHMFLCVRVCVYVWPYIQCIFHFEIFTCFHTHTHARILIGSSLSRSRCRSLPPSPSLSPSILFDTLLWHTYTHTHSSASLVSYVQSFSLHNFFGLVWLPDLDFNFQIFFQKPRKLTSLGVNKCLMLFARQKHSFSREKKWKSCGICSCTHSSTHNHKIRTERHFDWVYRNFRFEALKWTKKKTVLKCLRDDISEYELKQRINQIANWLEITRLCWFSVCASECNVYKWRYFIISFWHMIIVECC